MLRIILFLICALFAFLSGQGQCPLDLGETTVAPTANLLLHLPLDGNTANLGSGLYTMGLNGATYVPSICGDGLIFDGVDDFLSVSPTMNLDNDYTVTAWITPNSLANWMVLFCEREQCVSTYRGHSKAQLALNDFNVSGLNNLVNIHQNCTGGSAGDRYNNLAMNIPVGQPSFVALTVTNNSNENRVVTFYVNCGEFMGTQVMDYPTNTVFAGPWTYTTTIGATSGVLGQTKTFDGVIDDVRVYDAALNQDSIQAIYHSCLPMQMNVDQYTSCTSDSAVVTLFTTQPNVDYQLVDITNGQPLLPVISGSCDTIQFFTAAVMDTTQFQVLATNTISGCFLTLDSVITLFPNGQLALGQDSVFLCQGDSVIIGNIAVSVTGIFIDTIPMSGACDSLAEISVFVYPNPLVDLGNDTTLCIGSSLVLDATLPGANYLWQNGDVTPNFVINQAGVYWVQVSANGCVNSDTIAVSSLSPSLVNLGPDTTICMGNQMILDAGLQLGAVTWYDGSNGQYSSVTQAGVYWANVNLNGCIAVDSIVVLVDTIPVFDLGNDTAICAMDSILLSTGIVGGIHLWQDGNSNNAYYANQAGTYWSMVTNGSCTYSDTILINQLPSPIVYLGQDTSICIGDSLLLDAGNAGGQFAWQDGSNLQTFFANQAIAYSVSVLFNGCVASDSLIISFINPPQFNLGPDTVICDGSSIVLDVGSQSDITWSNGSSDQTQLVNSAGTYYVQVLGQCISVVDSILIQTEDCTCLLYVPNAFTPDGDGINDVFQVEGDCDFQEFELFIYTSDGQLIHQMDGLEDYWTGEFNGTLSKLDTYVWRMNYKSVGTSKKIEEFGHVTVVR